MRSGGFILRVGVVAVDGLVGQGEVVRRHLGGHREPAPLGVADQVDRARGADVRDVQAPAGALPASAMSRATIASSAAAGIPLQAEAQRHRRPRS